MAAHLFGVKLTLTSQLKQVEDIITPAINLETLLPVIVVVILRTNTAIRTQFSKQLKC